MKTEKGCSLCRKVGRYAQKKEGLKICLDCYAEMYRIMLHGSPEGLTVGAFITDSEGKIAKYMKVEKKKPSRKEGMKIRNQNQHTLFT